MKKLLYIFPFVWVLCLTAGCKDSDNETKPLIRIVEAQTSYPQQPSTGLIKFESENNASASSNQDWCTVSVAGKTVSVEVGENISIETRNATISITSGNESVEVDIIQHGVMYKLPEVDEMLGYDAGSTMTIDLTSLPYPVTIKNYPDWMIASLNGNLLTVEALSIRYGSPRTDYVVLEMLGYTKSLAITQNSFDKRSYEGFLGDYTLACNSLYSNLGVNYTIEISLIEKVHGVSYLIKGILPDESLGEVVMLYDEANRGLAINGQQICTNESGHILWLLPLTGKANSVYRSTSYGMISVIDSEEWTSFEFIDNDFTAGSFLNVGFRLRWYNVDAAAGNIGDPMCYWKMTKK